MKNKQLIKIMRQICAEQNMQEIVDITIGEKPDRIYFKFENTMSKNHPNHGRAPYINTTGTTIGEVYVMASKYDLVRDNKMSAKFNEGTQASLAFRLEDNSK